MVKNVGTADRVARIVVAGVLTFLTATPAVNGWAAYVCLAIAAYLLITAIISHCVIYDTLDISSTVHAGTYHSGEDVYDGRGGN